MSAENPVRAPESQVGPMSPSTNGEGAIFQAPSGHWQPDLDILPPELGVSWEQVDDVLSLTRLQRDFIQGRSTGMTIGQIKSRLGLFDRNLHHLVITITRKLKVATSDEAITRYRQVVVVGEQLRHDVTQLSEADQLLVTSFLVDGSYQSVAESLNMPVALVTQRLKRIGFFLHGLPASSLFTPSDAFRKGSELPQPRALEKLSPREREVFECIRKNMTDREVAEHLGIALGTAKRHVHNILAKLGMRSRFAATGIFSEHDGITYEFDPLTPRESEVLRLMQQGKTNPQIAELLVVELGTVKNHVHNILRKLGVPSRHEAVAALEKNASSSSSFRANGQNGNT